MGTPRILALLTPLVLLACGALADPAAASPPPSRWIAVSVATLWTKPGIARSIDAPSLGDPAHPRAWVAGMSVAQKRWLVGKLETQALYGTRVYLLGTSGRVVEGRRARPADAARLPGLPRMGADRAAHGRRAAEHRVHRRREARHGVAVDLADLDEQS